MKKSLNKNSTKIKMVEFKKMLLDFVFKTCKCSHENFPVEKEFGYCPDCGEPVENQWYITRCSCCGIKHKAVIRHGKVITAANYCQNCGSSEFHVERIPCINFIDINYAVLVRKSKRNIVTESISQAWVENPTRRNSGRQLLLTQCR